MSIADYRLHAKVAAFVLWFEFIKFTMKFLPAGYNVSEIDKGAKNKWRYLTFVVFLF
jgi:hypothetical protein